MGKMTKQQQQMIAFGVGLLFLGYFYWNYMLKPTMERIDANQAKYQEWFQLFFLRPRRGQSPEAPASPYKRRRA